MKVSTTLEKHVGRQLHIGQHTFLDSIFINLMFICAELEIYLFS